jgi:hypothetical protein
VTNVEVDTGRPRGRNTAPGPVLVVDDMAEVRWVIRQVLGYDGFTTVEAANGQEAARLLADGTAPSVILLDLTMPVMDGREFLAEVRPRRPRHPDVGNTPRSPRAAPGLCGDGARETPGRRHAARGRTRGRPPRRDREGADGRRRRAPVSPGLAASFMTPPMCFVGK